jgi:hypothetical protein
MKRTASAPKTAMIKEAIEMKYTSRGSIDGFSKHFLLYTKRVNRAMAYLLGYGPGFGQVRPWSSCTSNFFKNSIPPQKIYS